MEMSSMEAPTMRLWWVIGPPERKSSPYTRRSYQLKRAPGAAPGDPRGGQKRPAGRSWRSLKECISGIGRVSPSWKRSKGESLWAPQPPECLPRPEFYAWMQVTYEHFGHFWDRQQESWEVGLRVSRGAHHCALCWWHPPCWRATLKDWAAPFTHGPVQQPRVQSGNCHWHSRSRRLSRRRRHRRSHQRQIPPH